MKTPLALVTLLAASSAVAQTAPAAKKSPFQHSFEASYISSSSVFAGAPDVLSDFSGYTLAARVYVWEGLFLTVENVDTSLDVNSPDPGDPNGINVSRLGYGLGASFQVGGGLLSLSYTHGQVEFDLEGVVTPTQKNDQDRLSATYGQTFGNGFTAALGVTQFLNDGIDDETAVILTLGYDFKNGLSILATYSPDSADLGASEFSEDTFSVGVKYSF